MTDPPTLYTTDKESHQMTTTYTIEQFMGIGKWEAIATGIESEHKAQRFMRELKSTNPGSKYRLVKIRSAAF